MIILFYSHERHFNKWRDLPIIKIEKPKYMLVVFDILLKTDHDQFLYTYVCVMYVYINRKVYELEN